MCRVFLKTCWRCLWKNEMFSWLISTQKCNETQLKTGEDEDQRSARSALTQALKPKGISWCSMSIDEKIGSVEANIDWSRGGEWDQQTFLIVNLESKMVFAAESSEHRSKNNLLQLFLWRTHGLDEHHENLCWKCIRCGIHSSMVRPASTTKCINNYSDTQEMWKIQMQELFSSMTFHFIPRLLLTIQDDCNFPLPDLEVAWSIGVNFQTASKQSFG